MFLYANGVVLPPSHLAESLALTADFWCDLRYELLEQISSSHPDLPTAVWIVCADGAPVPASLRPAISRMRMSLPAGDIFWIEPQSDELSRWLCSSAFVLLVQLASDSELPATASLTCQHERLHHALPQQGTVVLSLPCVAEGALGRARYAGPRRLADDEEMQPARSLLFYSRGWEAARQTLMDDLPGYPLSQSGWTTRCTVAWALKQSAGLMHRNQRAVLWKAITMAILIASLLPALNQLTSRLLPLALLFAIGSFVLGVQPARERALQWWCLAQALWVQDSWHQFHLCELVTDRLDHGRMSGSADHSVELWHLLRCHDLALAVGPPYVNWGREELADSIALLEEHLGRLDRAIRRQTIERQLAWGSSGICGVLLVCLIAANHVVTKQILLVIATAGVALWYERPLPLVNSGRLIRHRRTLADEIHLLTRGLEGADLSQQDFRKALESSIQRVGVELIDLIHDAQDNRHWLRLPRSLSRIDPVAALHRRP